MSWRILYSKYAQKDAKKLSAAGLDKKTKALIGILKEDPWRTPPPYEKLVGDLQGFYSRRITIQHRLVYEVRESDRTVRILRMWSYYGE